MTRVLFAGLLIATALPVAANAQSVADFYRGKLQASSYFFKWELPKVHQQLDLLETVDTTTLDMQDNWF